MAEVLTHIDTLDVEVAGQEELDITVGSPMEHIRVLPITKNGKHVVSEYDIADVDVQPSLTDLTATENGTYLPKDYNADGFSKVDVDVQADKVYIYAEQVLYRKLTEYPENLDYVGLKNCASMFQNCDLLTSVPLFDTSNVTDMQSMFWGCNKIISIPKFDTSNVTIMYAMFLACRALTSVPQFDTSKVTNVVNMFAECTSIKSVPNVNTSRCNSLERMFNSCHSLTTVPELDAHNVTKLSYIFFNCSKLTNFGGLKNIGQAYTSTFTFDLSSPQLLTDESILNVLNGLYDMTEKGFSPTLKFHPTIKAKLTEEQIAIATNKNWNVI